MRLVTNDSQTVSDVALTLPSQPSPVEDETLWPREVDLILSAMEAATDESLLNRRQQTRQSYRVRAELSLFAYGPLVPPIILYTRDVSPEGLGFITRERVTLGYNGMVKFVAPNGETISAQCAVYRCREAVNGWYEGSLTFAVEQPLLA